MIRLLRPLVGMDRRTWDRLHVYHLVIDLLRRFYKPPRKSGHKKPGLNISSTGITSVPGLFSELFNVAASRPAQMTTERANTSSRRPFRQGKPWVNGCWQPSWRGGALAPSRAMRENKAHPSRRGPQPSLRRLHIIDRAAPQDEEESFRWTSYVATAPRPALARGAAQRDRRHRRAGPRPADATWRHHRSPDPGEADPGGRFSLPPGARGRHDAPAGAAPSRHP